MVEIESEVKDKEGEPKMRSMSMVTVTFISLNILVLTNKPDWHTKIGIYPFSDLAKSNRSTGFSDDIPNNWKSRHWKCLGRISPFPMTDWVIEGLRYKAKLFARSIHLMLQRLFTNNGLQNRQLRVAFFRILRLQYIWTRNTPEMKIGWRRTQILSNLINENECRSRKY